MVNNSIINDSKFAHLKEYKDVDLTNNKNILVPLISNIMLQYQNHLKDFLATFEDESYEITDRVKRWLNSMENAYKTFIDNMNEVEKLNKGDLLAYIYAHHIPTFHFNNVLHDVILNLIKNEFNDEEWKTFNLELYQMPECPSSHANYYVNYGEINTGKLSFDINKLSNIIEQKLDLNNNKIDRIKHKLAFSKAILPILENNYNSSYKPYERLCKNNMTYFNDSVEWLLNNNKIESTEKTLSKN